MSHERPNELYERTMKMLKPALERVASDPEFRNRLEMHPLEALAEVKVELDADTRRELEGKRFSEFWASRRKAVEGPVEVRDLPPEDGVVDDQTLESVSGGMSRGVVLEDHQADGVSAGLPRLERFAPPYVPVG